jgi:hypothetical protein
MKTLHKTLIGSVIALSLFLSGSQAYARTAESQIRAQLIELITQLIAELQEQLIQESLEVEVEEYDPTQSDSYPTQSSNNVFTKSETVQADGSDNDYVEFEIEFNLNSFGRDAFISQNSSAFNFSIVDAGSGLVVYDSDGIQNGSAIWSFSSSADLDSGDYRIDEDNPENFKLTVSYNPNEGGVSQPGSGSYRMRLDSVEYAFTSGGVTLDYNALPESKFRTNATIVVD